jgi:HEAT repeat protein
LAADRVPAGPGVEMAFDRGDLTATRNGREVWRHTPKGAEPGGEGRLEAHGLAEGRTAIHAVVTGAGSTWETVVLAGADGGSFRIAWEGATDLRGDPGERSAARVVFRDLTGDGLPEIVVGVVLEAVRICGAPEPALLFRRVFDPVAGRLRPVTADRPGLRQAVAGEIAGRLEAAASAAEPLLAVLSPAGMSSTAGDRGDPLLLSPPAALLDRDPATAWIPGNGSGEGEFVTFHAAAETWGLTRLGLRLLAAGRKAKPHGRPASMLLATGDRVLRLVLPPGAGLREGEIVWFDLPEPLCTACLTLVIETVESARPPALAELAAFTEIDAPGGLSRLAEGLDDGERGDAAARLLLRAGAAALDPVAEAWPGLSPSGRRRAARLVADLVPLLAGGDPSARNRAAALLVESALGADGPAALAAEAGLTRLGPAAVEPLAQALSTGDDDRFRRAAGLIAGLGHEESLTALAAATGSGGPDRRRLLRGLLSGAAASGPVRSAHLLVLLERARDDGERERLLDLARAATRVAAAEVRLADAVLPLYDAAEGFADRFRLLEVIAGLRDPRALPRLSAAARDPDHLIRAAAVRGLTLHAADPTAPEIAREALADGAPEVRVSALEALLRLPGVDGSAAGIERLAREDPWPRVRAAAAALAPALPEDAAVAVVAGALRDPSPVVREAGLQLAARLPDLAALDEAVRDRLADEGETPELLTRAARTAGQRCRASAVHGLRGILRRGAEPLAPPERVEAARAAARALGAIGGTAARTTLEETRKRANPAVARAIDEALADDGSTCRLRNHPSGDDAQNAAPKEKP